MDTILTRYAINLKLAGMLYDRYCNAVGGKSYNGDALPSWEMLKEDATKDKIVRAWQETADEAIKVLLTQKQP